MRWYKAVFLDKDGTIVENAPGACSDPGKIRFVRGAFETLRKLSDAGFKLIVVTNQGGIARGEFTEESFARVEREILRRLEAEGVRLDGFYHCPHDPLGTVARYATECDCRKPACGMVTQACADHDVDPSRSWLVGDILNDVEAGKRAGCRTVLVDVGNETVWDDSAERRPDFVARDFPRAGQLILQEEKERRVRHERLLEKR